MKVRRFIAVDDCGVRINPMIVDGQIHGGLAEGIGIALMEVITFDDEGNCLNGSFMDYLIPTALECPDFELGETVTPCPHHPLGAKGVGESPNVGSPPAIVNAVIDALYETHGVDHIDMPCTPGARVGRDAGERPAAPVSPNESPAKRSELRHLAPTSRRSRGGWPTSTTWSTRAWRRRCSSASASRSRCCWRGRPAWARPRPRRRWPRSWTRR